MQSKDLLSQNEIDALLDIFTTPTEEKSSDILFEVRMAKVARGIENYLEHIGLIFDALKVSTADTAVSESYHYTPEYCYLERLSIENRLALSILALTFGAKESDCTRSRELSSLEKTLLDNVSKEIAYILEKELDSYLCADEVLDKIADHSVLVLHEGLACKISFSFIKQRPLLTKIVVEKQLESESENVTATEVTAVLGTIDVKNLKEGGVYKLQTFDENRVILLLDKTLPFMAKRLGEDEHELSFALQEAVTKKTLLEGYYLCVAGTMIDDETLIDLAYGSVLKLTAYEVVEIHKDAKMVAKAKVFVLDGKIALRIDDVKY